MLPTHDNRTRTRLEIAGDRDSDLTIESYSDADLSRILGQTRTIAMIGASPDPERHSHRVMEYLQANGYRVIPVNPGAAGEAVLGETVVASIADVPAPVEMVDVFRRPDAVPGVVDEVLAVAADKGIRFLWLQLGLGDAAAAARAREAGLEVVMNRCLKIEYGRLVAHRH